MLILAAVVQVLCLLYHQSRRAEASVPRVWETASAWNQEPWVVFETRHSLAVDLVSLKPVIAPQVNQVKMSDLPCT